MSLDDILKDLQKNYLKGLTQKVALLELLWRQNDLNGIKTEYHKLKGTGRTYGLPEITQLGESMERICEHTPKNLDKALPLSLTLLRRVQEKRQSNIESLVSNSPLVPVQDHSLENDPDFIVLQSLAADLNPSKK